MHFKFFCIVLASQRKGRLAKIRSTSAITPRDNTESEYGDKMGRPAYSSPVLPLVQLLREPVRDTLKPVQCTHKTCNKLNIKK